MLTLKIRRGRLSSKQLFLRKIARNRSLHLLLKRMLLNKNTWLDRYFYSAVSHPVDFSRCGFVCRRRIQGFRGGWRVSTRPDRLPTNWPPASPCTVCRSTKPRCCAMPRWPPEPRPRRRRPEPKPQPCPVTAFVFFSNPLKSDCKSLLDKESVCVHSRLNLFHSVKLGKTSFT